MIVPVFLLLLLGLLEFGLIFDQTMTLNYATREGARSGAAFGRGNGATMPCADVDKNVIAAVQRILKGPGSRLTLAPSTQIVIYRANASGTSTGQANTWNYSAGGGPAVDGQNLDFVLSGAAGWDACSRVTNATTVVSPDSMGISIRYTYQFVTPLAAILGFFGSSGTASLQISDKTVMAMNPAN
jgi:Flp pilus assembly protein TadG